MNYLENKNFVEMKFRTTSGNNVYEQTKILFKLLEPHLKETIRTWIYIKDIDKNYSGMVKARNEIFDDNGLTPGNHFIASTGIGSPSKNFLTGEIIKLNALIVSGVNQNEFSYISNEEVMPNTSDYGVRFERGVIYQNIYILSGTASIDEFGEVKYPGDIVKQTLCAIDNMNSLLTKYYQSIFNTKKIIGYVRNKKDIKTVKDICREYLPGIIYEIKEGKVCRPEWLVEFETMFEGE